MQTSRHVRSGKTRTRIETPRLVREACVQSIGPHRFSDPVYFKLDFLNGARFNPQFDTSTMLSSVALGARLVKSFYGDHVPLKRVEHIAAPSHIAEWVIQHQEEPSNSKDIVFPIVIYMDDFGEYIHERNNHFRNKAGKDVFLSMLKDIGFATLGTNNDAFGLSKLHDAGQYVIVPITTGTLLIQNLVSEE